MKPTSTLFAALSLLSFITATPIGETVARHEDGGHSVYVRAGQSIQAAIDKALEGTEIVVEAGTYPEHLTVQKDGLTITGRPDARLVPPGNFTDNLCTGLAGNEISGLHPLQAGICIHGSNIHLSDFVTEHKKVLSVGNPVKGVAISGLTVSGFAGINIAAVGSRDTCISGNTIVDGGAYGILADGSYNSVIRDNVVSQSTLGSIGVCSDNFDGAKVSKNDVSGYVIGLCVQTNGADIRDNNVHGNCIGTFVDPRTRGARIKNNHVGPTNAICNAIPDIIQPDFMRGIVVDGSTDTLVQGNVIEGQRSNGTATGIVVRDDPCNEGGLACSLDPTPAIASRNLVVGNTLRNNDVDLGLASIGDRNIFKRNDCRTSSPRGLCRRT